MIEIAGRKYFTVSEAAKKFNKADKTIRRWIKEGRLDAKKVGGSFLISEANIIKMVEGD